MEIFAAFRDFLAVLGKCMPPPKAAPEILPAFTTTMACKKLENFL